MRLFSTAVLATLTGDDQKDKVTVTCGMTPGRKGHYAVMLHHKNRLIKAYEKMGCQLKVGEKDFNGVGGTALKITNVISPPSDVRSKGRGRGHRCH